MKKLNSNNNKAHHNIGNLFLEVENVIMQSKALSAH